jgi:urease accessory protein
MGAAFASLMLADGRFPAGGHVHSAGVEPAVADGRVVDLASLERFLVGRLWTAGLTEAALAAATVVRLTPDPGNGAVIAVLDTEANARVAVPALRAASRKLGRQLLRVGARCWPAPATHAARHARADGVHYPVALGAVACAAGGAPHDAAQLALHHTITTPAQAAVRLLGLDPYAVAALTVDLASMAAEVSAQALSAAHGPLDELPARTGPVVDVAAAGHRRWDGRLFAT